MGDSRLKALEAARGGAARPMAPAESERLAARGLGFAWRTGEKSPSGRKTSSAWLGPALW